MKRCKQSTYRGLGTETAVAIDPDVWGARVSHFESGMAVGFERTLSLDFVALVESKVGSKEVRAVLVGHDGRDAKTARAMEEES